MLLILALHAVLAALAPWLAARIGRRALLVAGIAPACGAVALAFDARRVLTAIPVEQHLEWAPSLGVSVDLRLDAFALLMGGLVTVIGVLVFAYAYAYFSTPQAGIGRFTSALTAFAGAMLGLVLADNVVLLFVFWELTTVTSYLLVGYHDEDPAARDAALQALLTTAAGGLAMLAGFVLLAQAAGTYELSALLAAAPDGGSAEAALVLVLLGAFTKSAQVPFHYWLPGAMAAPTPVSAYLHSATMVKAGVYLVARLAPAFAAAAVWRPLVLGVGLATMLLGGWRALRQHDLKRLLAFGTVSQLGFLTLLFGMGHPKATFAGVVLLLAHALFKAALFLVVGTIDKLTGTRDLRSLRGLARPFPVLAAVAVLAAASMAGVPVLFGFVAKEVALEALFQAEFAGAAALLAGVAIASVLTFAYSARLLSPFAGASTRGRGGRSAMLVAPAALLAAVTVVFGVAPWLAQPLTHAATRALVGAGWAGVPLVLWHGLTPALALSALVLALGAVLVVAREQVERVQGRLPVVIGALDVYAALLRGTLATAGRVTGILQNGSLPVYLSVISLTLVALPGSALFLHGARPAVRAAANDPVQAAVAVLVMAGAVATTFARRRFAAVLFLGAVGYGVGVLFVLHSAPDLALTQFLIETLAIVIFVLVLRHLPRQFSEIHLRALRPYRALRLLVAGAVGLFVFVFALVAAAARTIPPVSEEHIARALPEAAGRNVVNVILVDFRALDTLGEITVLVVAALGTLLLVRAVRRGEDAQETTR